MTCIVGLETEKGVLIGGDSASSDGWNMNITRLRKVFKRGEFLIGYTTSFRMGQLLEYRLSVKQQEKEQSDLEYLATAFIDAVRGCLKDGGFKKVENEQEEGGTFLVGYKGQLYMVGADFQVNSSTDGFMAVGCGREYALGNILSSKNLLSKKRVEQALEAASRFSNSVREPFYIILQGV